TDALRSRDGLRYRSALPRCQRAAHSAAPRAAKHPAAAHRAGQSRAVVVAADRGWAELPRPGDAPAASVMGRDAEREPRAGRDGALADDLPRAGDHARRAGL